jgi:hypothetical protein
MRAPGLFPVEEYMVRNFKTANSSPFFPIRFWRNKNGPGELAFTIMARMTVSGAVAVTNRTAQAISSTRLLLESTHGATLGRPEDKAGGLVFSMILSL